MDFIKIGYLLTTVISSIDTNLAFSTSESFFVFICRQLTSGEEIHLYLESAGLDKNGNLK